jgi:hypothetical protein
MFFLLYSVPHRVHHFFDRITEAHQHDGRDRKPEGDHNNRTNGESSCVFEASASRCQARLSAPRAPASSPTIVATISILSSAQAASSFFPKALQIRAPPQT